MVSVRKALERTYRGMRSYGEARSHIHVTCDGGILYRDFHRRVKGLPYEYQVDFDALVTGKGEALRPKPATK